MAVLTIGFDGDVLGTVTDVGGRLRVDSSSESAKGSIEELWQDCARRMVEYDGADPDKVTGADVLAYMAARMNGRTWAALDGGAQQMADSAHVGEPDGVRVFSEEQYEGLSFADRSKLVKKQVRDKNGVLRTVYVSPDSAGPEAERTKPRDDAKAAVDVALADPSKLTAAQLGALGDHLHTLTVQQKRAVAREIGAKIGGNKRELAQRLLERIKAQNAITGGPVPERPKLPEPEYRHKDASDPIVSQILADAGAREVLDRVREKVAAIEPARSAAFEAELAHGNKRRAYYDLPEPGPFRRTDAWKRKEEAKRKARQEMQEASDALNRAENAHYEAKQAIREEVVKALAHNTKSVAKETWGDAIADTPQDTVPLPKTDTTKQVVNAARDFVTAVCANMGEVPVSYGVASTGRAFANTTRDYDPATQTFFVLHHAIAMSKEPANNGDYGPKYATEVQVHEWGHVIEFSKPGVKELANAFVEYRCKGEAPTNLRARFPHHDFDASEEGRADDFARAFGQGAPPYYVGKMYFDGSTEVISMGLELLYKDPAGFVSNDPEYAQFIFKVLRA